MFHRHKFHKSWHLHFRSSQPRLSEIHLFLKDTRRDSNYELSQQVLSASFAMAKLVFLDLFKSHLHILHSEHQLPLPGQRVSNSTIHSSPPSQASRQSLASFSRDSPVTNSFPRIPAITATKLDIRRSCSCIGRTQAWANSGRNSQTVEEVSPGINLQSS